MNAQEYEEFVARIVKSAHKQVKELQPEQVGSGRTNHIEGVSGHKHQIDVSIRDDEDLILVECKRRKRRVTVEHVLAFLGRIYDIGQKFKKHTVHGTIVTTVGFQPGAKKVADHYEIELHLCREDSHSFKFKHLLLIQPAPAAAGCGTSGPMVTISEARNHSAHPEAPGS
ncbi:MAG: restriction endonuclease [Anaerolineae bacterium]|nr:restriction endonuclease [Anaerolineae bacterium]